MKRKIVIIRFIISIFFLISLVFMFFFKETFNFTNRFISFYGSFVIAIYSFFYGIENIIDKKINLGIFFILFFIMIMILNIYMLR